MKKTTYFFSILFMSIVFLKKTPIYSQNRVGINTVSPNATLDINGNLKIRNLPTNNANSDFLTIDDTGNKIVTKKTSIPFFVVNTIPIPICSLVSIGSTGSSSITILGTTYTINWTVMGKSVGTGANNTSDEESQKLIVEYNFSPSLPFSPSMVFITPYNNSAYPDTFDINYTIATNNKLRANITRVDISSTDDWYNCWAGSFYFDLILFK